MSFAREWFWAFQTRATLWAIFEKFPLLPPLHFFRKSGFSVTMRKYSLLGHSGTFGAVVCAKIFSSLCTLRAYKLEDNAIFARELLGLSNEGYFSGDFWKISRGPPFALFQKMRVLGDFAKIALTWPFGHFWKRCLRQNLFQSLHFNSIQIKG